MGKQQSKEEIIIAQAGNSGGQTNEANQNKGASFGSIQDVLTVIVLILMVLFLGWLIFIRCKKSMDGKED